MDFSNTFKHGREIGFEQDQTELSNDLDPGSGRRHDRARHGVRRARLVRFLTSCRGAAAFAGGR